MKFKHLSLALLLGAFLPLSAASATKITGLGVSASNDNLVLLWDALSGSDFDDADGYAVQWSDRESYTDITDSVTFYVDGNVDDSSLRRNSFENDTYYYFRVYAYELDANNQRVLRNGSDRLKFKVDFLNQITTETISVTDPVVDTSSGSEVDVSDFEFGTLRKYPYDTFVDLFWSRPREMTSSDYDGFMIVLSEKSDMTDPILETQVMREANSVRVTGLKPETQYYAQGHFDKNSNPFGGSDIRSFKTIAAVPRDNSTRQSRNIVKVENRAIRKVAVDGTETPTTTTTTDTSNSSSSSSSTTTVTSSSQSEIDSADQTEVSQKISELKRQIIALQSELRRWEAKLDKKTTSSSSTRSSSGLSVRERLKLILEAKRHQ